MIDSYSVACKLLFLTLFDSKTPAMQRTWKIGLLLGARGASSVVSSTNVNVATGATNTINKFLPLLRKLSQEPRVTNKANEVLARIGERMVSRGLRAVFGLPEPTFEVVDSEHRTNSVAKLAP